MLDWNLLTSGGSNKIDWPLLFHLFQEEVAFVQYGTEDPHVWVPIPTLWENCTASLHHDEWEKWQEREDKDCK